MSDATLLYNRLIAAVTAAVAETITAATLSVVGSANVTFDAATQAIEGPSDGVLSLVHTASGANRGAYVVVWQQGAVASSTTYDGAAMTQIFDVQEPNSNVNITGFILPAIPTGAKTVTSTLNDTTVRHGMFCISVNGLHQTVPNGTAVTATGTAGPSSATAGSVGANDLVVDASYCQASGAPTVGANQTERANPDFAANFQFCHGSTQAGADGGVMTWTLNGPDYWCAAAVALKPA